MNEELPDAVVEQVTHLTKLAKRTDNDQSRKKYREHRDSLLENHGFQAHVRKEDTGNVLVCFPAEWIADGVAQLDSINDRSRAIEVPLFTTESDLSWPEIDDHNMSVVEEIRSRYGDDHAENARIFAEYMGNHYLSRVENASASNINEFLTEYYPRNAWPTEDQKRIVTDSLRYLFRVTDNLSPIPLE